MYISLCVSLLAESLMYVCMCLLQAHSHSKSMSEYTVSRLHLVDLAGSDRLSKTQVIDW